MFKRGDFVVLGVILALSAALGIFFSVKDCKSSASPGSMSVVISIDGQEQAVLPLDRDTVYTTPGGGNIIEIKDGAVRMTDAGCPDKLCKKQGSISKAGEAIICLPNRVSVTLRGESDDVDAVAY